MRSYTPARSSLALVSLFSLIPLYAFCLLVSSTFLCLLQVFFFLPPLLVFSLYSFLMPQSACLCQALFCVFSNFLFLSLPCYIVPFHASLLLQGTRLCQAFFCYCQKVFWETFSASFCAFWEGAARRGRSLGIVLTYPVIAECSPPPSSRPAFAGGAGGGAAAPE